MTTATIAIPQAERIARLKHLERLVNIALNSGDTPTALRVVREIRETERHTGRGPRERPSHDMGMEATAPDGA